MLTFCMLVLAAGAVITMALAFITSANIDEKIREDENSHKKTWC
jgi:hypothetical protein